MKTHCPTQILLIEDRFIDTTHTKFMKKFKTKNNFAQTFKGLVPARRIFLKGEGMDCRSKHDTPLI